MLLFNEARENRKSKYFIEREREKKKKTLFYPSGSNFGKNAVFMDVISLFTSIACQYKWKLIFKQSYPGFVDCERNALSHCSCTTINSGKLNTFEDRKAKLNCFFITSRNNIDLVPWIPFNIIITLYSFEKR